MMWELKKRGKFLSSEKRKKLLTLIGGPLVLFLLILSLGTKPSTVNAATRDWNEGDEISYKFSFSTETEIISPDGKISSKFKSESTGSTDVIIGHVDEINEQYNLTSTRIDFTESVREITQTFNATQIGREISQYLEAPLYVAVDEQNHEHLVGYDAFWFYPFYISFNSFKIYFVDPNWDEVNKPLLQLWDETRPISSYEQPSPRYTFGDVLRDAVSFKLMGKSSLDEARQVLIDESPHKWTMEFDLSGIVEWYEHEYLNNGAERKTFQSYDKYYFKEEMEYTEGGTLKRLFYSLETETTSKDESTMKGIINFEITLDQGGGLLPGGKVNFSSISTLLALGTLTTTALLTRIRKNRKRHQ